MLPLCLFCVGYQVLNYTAEFCMSLSTCSPYIQAEFRRHVLGDFGSLAKAALTSVAVMTLYGLKKLLPS